MDETVTLNNILDLFKQVADGHDQINDYGHGHTSNIGKSLEENRPLKHPFLWTDYRPTSYVVTQNQGGIAFKLYTVSVTVVDKYSPNIKNSQEVMSDMEQCLADVIQFIANNPFMRKYRIQVQTYVGEPTRDEDQEGVEGWTTVIAFKIPFQYCYKQLPITLPGNGNA